MADEKINVNPALSQDGDDTVTRKTIKLRPAMPTVMASKPAASPSVNVSTDTGNVDLGDNTQTRRTIKLKPIAPVVTAKPAAPAAAPVAPASAAVPAAPAAPAAAPGADGDNTVTRKTIKLKPIAPAATPTAPAAAKPAATAAPAAEDPGEKTIRIQRPVKPAVTGPAVAPRPVSAAPAQQTAKPAAPASQEVKIPALKKKPETTPAAATEPAVKTEEGVAAVKANDGIYAKIYLVTALLALICMIYGTLLVTVQFLDLTQGQNIAEKISFIVPGAK